MSLSKTNQLVQYTKTREARTAPVPREILELLGAKLTLEPDARIVPQITNSYGHVTLKPLMREAGIRQVRMHDLRHIFASHLLSETKDLLLARDILGHRSTATTQTYVHRLSEVYMHAMEEVFYGATDALVAGLAGAAFTGGTCPNAYRLKGLSFHCQDSS